MAEDVSSLLTEESIAGLIREAPPNAELNALTATNMDLRPAAVLVPLLWEEDHWSLLFTRRTETVQSHKGQVSFPGGGADPSDDSPETTALREAFEEIGLPPGSVRILGTLAVRPTISHYLVTPVVGRVAAPVEYLLSEHEVSHVFSIPLGWLADPANWEERPHPVPNGFFERVIYYRPYAGEILWGATARMTHDLLNVLGLIP
jgi:8-oxo-dGTP pyrophosphatase MutT (NUDIX family)